MLQQHLNQWRNTRVFVSCFVSLNNSEKVEEKNHNEDCKGQRRQGDSYQH